MVLDLDETLVCAYNHELNGGVPPELSTPEAVAKTTRFTLHKDPRHGTRGGVDGDDAIAPGEPVPLVASTTTRGGDWARAIGAGALADRIDQTATDLGEPVCTVIERPGVREFLAQLATFAEVCVFTAGMEGYARPLLDAIDPAGDAIHHRLYRQACVKTPIRDHVKDISRLGRDLSATVIVDNNPFSFLLQPHNGIPIVSFTGDPGDDGLLRQLLPVLRAARARATRPIVIHCCTVKGKGYAPAERAADRGHGVSKFDPATGAQAKSSGGAPSYTAVFGESLTQEAARDERIVAVTAAMPDGTGVAKMAARFPGRVFDVGIAEQHAVTFAAGMAASGLRPFCAKSRHFNNFTGIIDVNQSKPPSNNA